ncbi:MAG TPA: alpha/beta hydrolase [Steroidobacteraceae bacterium]|nr:alpha/beta hydrolase [Steroidobacteraceae bacterium]
MHCELQVEGARLRYRDEGSGRAIVFVHGWTLDLDVWEPQLPLAAELRVVRYDRRGFGLSSGDPSLAHDVADLGTLLTVLGVVSPLLVGMSQGARVVLEFAARHPSFVCGLVLDGAPPPPGGPITDDLPLDSLRLIAGHQGMDAFRRAWRLHPLTQLVTGDARMHALLARILARYPGRDLLAPGAAGREAIDRRLLADVRVPVLVINGARDTESRRRAGALLRDALPSAEHVLIANAAHFPNLDAPREYNQLMSGFARRHLPAAA